MILSLTLLIFKFDKIKARCSVFLQRLYRSWCCVLEKVLSISDLVGIFQRRCQAFLTLMIREGVKLSWPIYYSIYFREGVKLSWPLWYISEKVSRFPDSQVYFREGVKLSWASSIFLRRCQAFLTFIVYIREGVKLSWPL